MTNKYEIIYHFLNEFNFFSFMETSIKLNYNLVIESKYKKHHVKDLYNTAAVILVL